MQPVARSRGSRRATSSPALARGLAEASYYYAGGEKIRIEADADRIAVDLSRVRGASRKIRDFLKHREGDKALKGGITLVERKAIPKRVLDQLERQAALHPVYRHGETLLVVLPEVRVELSEPQQESVRTFVSRGPVRAAIQKAEGDRMILRPVSGKGADAITLANTLHETIHPKMAQARFLRVVRKP